MVRAFDRAARHYDQAAVLPRQAADILLERLELLRIQPEYILDAGSGTGHGARRLARRYQRARVLHLDLSHAMLCEARRLGPRWFSRHRYLCASMTAIPLRAGSVQLVYSNLALHWCASLDSAFGELYRVLGQEGLLLFSCSGPDTLQELRDSWPGAPEEAPVHSFPDLHTVGDAVARAGFTEPVLETDRLVLCYAGGDGTAAGAACPRGTSCRYGAPPRPGWAPPACRAAPSLPAPPTGGRTHSGDL